MALPSSGSITMAQVNVELGKAANAGITMNDSEVRVLSGVPSGAISMSNLHGKSSEVRYINTVNLAQATIHAIMGSPTAPGTYIFENHATIHAATQSGWALQTGAFPAGSTLKIINRGHIRGGGGIGGSQGSPGAAGGSALVLNFPTTIDNTGGTIWGGGGGGGYGRSERGNMSMGGGGGAGIPAGAGGYGSSYNGQSGSATAGGAGGSGGGGVGGACGAGGARGKSSAGGRGGYSVQGNGNPVAWIDYGSLAGAAV